MSALRKVFTLLAALALAFAAQAQEFGFQAPAGAGDPQAGALLRDLAERILPVYEEPDALRYFEYVSALQMTVGDYKAAADSRRTLRERRAGAGGRELLLDLYAQAKAREAAGGASFAQAFTQVFREQVPRLGDREAYAVAAGLGGESQPFRERLESHYARLRGRQSIALPEALELIRTQVFFDAHRSADALLATLVAEDDARRYVVEDVRIPGRAGIRARVVRPRRSAKPLTTLLQFTVLPAADDARECAAHGYAGVVAWTRGKDFADTKSRRRVIPFEHDGEDARTVIEWIVRQPWSDDRVAMYGDGYGGFAAWAAAKRLPRALKAIATADAMAPGIDFPTEGRVFRNAAYRWAATHTRAARVAPGEEAQWRALDQAWYRRGEDYRALDLIAPNPEPGPNRVFRRWLGHPTYDSYWRGMIPTGAQFGKIGIPVLSVTGYYAPGAVGALHYFTQHRKHRNNADHTLLIGPYADTTTRDRPALLRGYTPDAAALLDLRALRFQWFDHLFRNAPKPALLKDRVNYQLMGANEWRHAASLETAADGVLKFHLAAGEGGRQRLLPARPARAAPIRLTVDLADRSDAGLPPPDIASRSLDARHGLVFLTEPLTQPADIAGVLSGQLDFELNKLDVDFYVALYEMPPNGEFLLLADPYEFRASYAADRTRRQPLAAGQRQQLKFRSEQMMGRRVPAGSRLLLLLGVNKRPDRQINYGAGKDVSEESIADAGKPLRLRWYSGSYIEVPVRR